jgi:hypothetical protein
MKQFVFFSLFIALVSCSDLKKNDQLQVITSMEHSLDSISTVLEANEIDTIAGLSMSAEMVERRIKNHYNTDTVDMEMGNKMDAYKTARKSFSPLGSAYYKIQNGLNEEKETLKKLKSDIENGDGDRKKYEEYIIFEQAKVTQLEVLLNDYVEQKTKMMNLFHSLHPELEAFSFELMRDK